MSLQYDFYANPPSGGSNRKPRLHARVRTFGTTSTQMLAQVIKETTSLSTADVKAAIDALAEAMAFELTSGRRVHLDGLGYFSLTLSCPPIHSPKEVRAESVKVKNIVFRPDEEWKDRVRSAQLVRTREKNHSVRYSDIEIDGLLTGHFLDHSFISTLRFCGLCSCTQTTGRRKIVRLVEAGKLRRVGYGNVTLYEPVPGHYRR